MAFVNAGGIPALGKGQFDNLMNGTAMNVDGSTLQAHQIETFLLAHPDADFTALAGGPGPTGYAAGDVTNFKSAYSDLEQFYQIYIGAQNLAVAKDFRTFVKLIIVSVH
jgi:hypothetical protein